MSVVKPFKHLVWKVWEQMMCQTKKKNRSQKTWCNFPGSTLVSWAISRQQPSYFFLLCKYFFYFSLHNFINSFPFFCTQFHKFYLFTCQNFYRGRNTVNQVLFFNQSKLAMIPLILFLEKHNHLPCLLELSSWKMWAINFFYKNQSLELSTDLKNYSKEQ